MDTTPYLLPISELSKGDVLIAGGKASLLGEAKRNGVLTPDGYVLTTSAYDAFIVETGIQEKIEKIVGNVVRGECDISKASKELRAGILQSAMPKYLRDGIFSVVNRIQCSQIAVRSSAPFEDGVRYSWAGQFDSFLHVQKDEVEQYVLLCWASLYTERALWYAKNNGLLCTNMKMAVLLQEMLVAETSGVAFSAHPVTGARDVMYVEAVFDSVKSVVDGKTTPCAYVIHKKTGAIQKQYTHNDRTDSPFVPETLVRSLLPVVCDIESVFGYPCDVEWLYSNDALYVTQVRSITATGLMLQQ